MERKSGSIEERELHELHNGLEGVLGPDQAATLMSRLSPVSWPDVATKADIAATRADMKTLGDTLRLEMASQCDRVRADLTSQMSSQTRTLVVAYVMALLAVAGLVLGVR